MKISVIGSGYVGLVVGTCLAATGNDIICVDKETQRIEALREGRVPFYEPGLSEMVLRNVRAGRLQFTDNLAEAVSKSLVIFLAVGTPQRADGSCDTSNILELAGNLSELIDSYKIIVIKSTVPVGTGREVEETIRGKVKCEFDVVSNPEFLKEGAAIDDFMKPDRVIIGTDNPRTAEIMKQLYGPFVRTGNPILMMRRESAELVKYAVNGLLATRISFMNEIANLCELVGADVDEVRYGIGSDARLGPKFLFPGIGYGGSCFPKDTRAIINQAQQKGYEPKILSAVDEVNARQKRRLVEKMEAHFGSLSGKRIAVWGLSFKPGTDDMRSAPSVVVIEEVLKKGGSVAAYDPVAIEEAKRLFGDRISYGENTYSVLEGADALALITEWTIFRRPDVERIAELMADKVIFDGRNVLNKVEFIKAGFTYYGIGR